MEFAVDAPRRVSKITFRDNSKIERVLCPVFAARLASRCRAPL